MRQRLSLHPSDAARPSRCERCFSLLSIECRGRNCRRIAPRKPTTPESLRRHYSHFVRNAVHRASHDRCHVEAVASLRGRGARNHEDVANRGRKKDSKQPWECHLQVGLCCRAPCTAEGVGVDVVHHADAAGSAVWRGAGNGVSLRSAGCPERHQDGSGILQVIHGGYTYAACRSIRSRPRHAPHGFTIRL